LAGSAPWKSSEKRSSFFFAIDSAGIVGKSAAKAADVMRKESARKGRMFNKVAIRSSGYATACILASKNGLNVSRPTLLELSNALLARNAEAA
jgi:hypothetical protein